MRATLEQTALTAALARVAGTADRRVSIPILGCVLIRPSTDGHLLLQASDIDMEAITTVHPADGAISPPLDGYAVDAATLGNIVKRLPSGAQVALESDGDRMTVRSGRSRFALPVLPGGDFPRLTAASAAASGEVSAATLMTLIDRCQRSISTEETRYYLNGIYLHVVDGRLRAVATDGHRLAVATGPAPDALRDLPPCIVPRKMVAEMRKLLPGRDTVTLSVSESGISIASGLTTLTSKLIDGIYPDYQRVIPEGGQGLLEVDAAHLTEAVSRVAIVGDGKVRAIRLTLGQQGATLSAAGEDGSTAEETLDQDRTRYTGPEIVAGLNSRYLLDTIESTGADRLALRLTDAATAITLTATAGGEETAIFVLMPMRV